MDSNERNHVTYVVFLIVKIVSHSLHFKNKAVDGQKRNTHVLVFFSSP